MGAINVRLSAEAEQALSAPAAQARISRNEVVNRAILEAAARQGRDGEVRELARAAISRYGPLLARLAE